MPAKIDDLISNRFQTLDRAAGNIIHISKSACLVAIPVNFDRLSLSDPLGKTEHGHIRPSRRAIHGEVAEDGHIQSM